MIKIEILGEESEPIVINGSGENIRIPRVYHSSSSTPLYEFNDEWKVWIFVDSFSDSGKEAEPSPEHLEFPSFRSNTYLDINGIRAACVDGVLQYLEEHNLIEQDDEYDKFIIYEITLNKAVAAICVYLEILDSSGEIEFELEDNTSIIPNLISYERKGIRKIKK